MMPDNDGCCMMMVAHGLDWDGNHRGHLSYHQMEASYTQDSKLSGMELNGTLDYQLLSLQALKTMDLSNNHLHDSIPYQLPSNLTYLNLAKNNFSGNLPYSISNLVSLEYLNLSHNSLNSLSELDVSFNNLTGIFLSQWALCRSFLP
uniref:Uncharacterized protein n=1 Tax=Zea mays TaxID=4577 RepID=A0A804M971_MAIZE